MGKNKSPKNFLSSGFLYLFEMLIFPINAKYRGVTPLALFTQTNYKIASSTTCGHLKPEVADTFPTKSMLAHLLSTINH